MPKKSVSPLLRKLVVERALGCCEYCMSQEYYSASGFTIDHIDPSGGDEMENLALACHKCNKAKFNKTKAIDPKSQELVAIFNPRRNKWTDHFGWNVDFVTIVGITPIGRATIQRLDMNRSYLQNQRVLYRLAGIHPSAHSIA